jgi:cytochrome c6
MRERFKPGELKLNWSRSWQNWTRGFAVTLATLCVAVLVFTPMSPVWGISTAAGLPTDAGAQATASPAGASESGEAAAIFESTCSGCHINGGNIVRRGKTLKLKALQKNQLDNLEAIATLVAQGKGNMSAYADKLSPEQIQAVAQYVLDQAQAGWKA